MLNIPLQAVPNQKLSVTLSGQQTQLRIFTSIDGKLFMDVQMNNADIITGVICQNNNRIVRDAYLGFVGDLFFTDTQGSNDPEYSGLGSRYVLVYLSAAEVAAL